MLIYSLFFLTCSIQHTMASKFMSKYFAKFFFLWCDSPLLNCLQPSQFYDSNTQLASFLMLSCHCVHGPYSSFPVCVPLSPSLISFLCALPIKAYNTIKLNKAVVLVQLHQPMIKAYLPGIFFFNWSIYTLPYSA